MIRHGAEARSHGGREVGRPVYPIGESHSDWGPHTGDLRRYGEVTLVIAHPGLITGAASEAACAPNPRGKAHARRHRYICRTRFKIRRACVVCRIETHSQPSAPHRTSIDLGEVVQWTITRC